VESARADARAEVIQAERDVSEAEREIRDIEDRTPRSGEGSGADSDRVGELQETRADAEDRLDENLGIESDPASAVKDGEIQEAERARAAAGEAEREAEEARQRGR
jgi:hypothetical protein